METKTLTTNYEGDLMFGNGTTKSPITSLEQRRMLSEQVNRQIVRLTVPKTAFCMEDRRTIRFFDGLTDPKQIIERVAYQKPGGLHLAVTKAAVAANLAFLAKAKNFTHAYQLTRPILEAAGWEDSAHVHCGADANVQKSVTTKLPNQLLVLTLQVSIGMNPVREKLLNDVSSHQDRLLQDGFYEGWVPANHLDYAVSKWPQNCFEVEDVAHAAVSIVQIDQEGFGFQKNGFIEDTNEMAFAISRSVDERFVQLLCGPEVEKERLRLAFADDEAHVANLLIAPGMPYLKAG